MVNNITTYYVVIPDSITTDCYSVPLPDLIGFSKSNMSASLYMKQISEQYKVSFTLYQIQASGVNDLTEIIRNTFKCTIDDQYEIFTIPVMKDGVDVIYTTYNLHDHYLEEYFSYNYDSIVNVVCSTIYRLFILSKYIDDPMFRKLISKLLTLYLVRVYLVFNHDVSLLDHDVIEEMMLDDVYEVNDVINIDVLIYQDYCI